MSFFETIVIIGAVYGYTFLYEILHGVTVLGDSNTFKLSISPQVL